MIIECLVDHDDVQDILNVDAEITSDGQTCSIKILSVISGETAENGWAAATASEIESILSIAKSLHKQKNYHITDDCKAIWFGGFNTDNDQPYFSLSF